MRRSTQLLVAVLLVFGLGCSATMAPTPDLPQHQKQEQLAPVMPPHGVYPRPLQKPHVASVTWMVVEFASPQEEKLIFMTHGQDGEDYWVQKSDDPQNQVVYSVTEDVMVSRYYPNVLYHQFYVLQLHPPKNEFLQHIVVSVEDLNDDGDTVKYEVYELQAMDGHWFRLDLDDPPNPNAELKKVLSAQYE